MNITELVFFAKRDHKLSKLLIGDANAKLPAERIRRRLQQWIRGTGQALA